MSDLGLIREKNFSSDTWSKLKNLMKFSKTADVNNRIRPAGR